MKHLFKLLFFLLRLVAGLLIVILLFLFFCWGFFQTPFGLSKLEGFIQKQLNQGADQTARFEGLTGHPPFHVYVDLLSIKDEQGEWFRLETFRFDLSFFDLFKGTISLDALGADYVNLQRLPPAKEKKEKPKTKPSTISLPAFFPTIDLSSIYIRQLILGPTLTGLDSEFTLELSALVDIREAIKLDAKLIRVDGLQDSFSAHLAITNKLSEGAFALSFFEGDGGVISQLAGKRFDDLQLSLHGAGPTTNWLGNGFLEIGPATNRIKLLTSYCFANADMFEWRAELHDTMLQTTPEVHIEISAPLKRPVLSAYVGAKAINLSNLAQMPLEPFDFSIQALLANGHLQAAMTTTGLTSLAVNGKADLPIEFTFNPFVVNVSKTKEVIADLQTHIDLQLLAPFLQTFQQNSKGNFQSQLSLRGTFEHPMLNGYLKMDDGLYENLTMGTLLRDIDVDVLFDKKGIHIKNMAARDANTGTLRIQGAMTFDEEKNNPMDFHLLVDKALLVNQQMIAATINADIAITGSTKRITIVGTSSVESVSINIHETMPPDVTELQVEVLNKPGEIRQATPKKKEPPAIARQILLNLDLLSPGHIYVKGRGLDSEWKADIRVRGDAAAPNITGSLDLVRGTFDFLGKRLKLEQCTVTMLGGLPFVPQIDIRASTTTSKFIANLRIYGSATQPQIALSSEPSYPEDEILSMMLFGKRPDELSATEAIKIAYGINVLRGGFGGLGLFDKAQKMLGVDQLGISQNNDNQAQLSVGKYIGRYIYIEGEKSLQGDGNSLKVDINITPNIQLRTKASNEENEGESIYINWHRDY